MLYIPDPVDVLMACVSATIIPAPENPRIILASPVGSMIIPIKACLQCPDWMNARTYPTERNAEAIIRKLHTLYLNLI